MKWIVISFLALAMLTSLPFGSEVFVYAQEQIDGAWWEAEEVPQNLLPAFMQDEWCIERSTQADDLAMAKALAEHDWTRFLGLLDVPDGTAARLKRAEEDALYAAGLMGLYRLCGDRTVQHVFPVRMLPRQGRWNGVVFCGVTESEWLRPVGGLCVWGKKGAPGFVEEISDAPDPVPLPGRARIPVTLDDRLACMRRAPSEFDALTQSGGMVLARLLRRAEPAEVERGPIQQTMEFAVLGAVCVRPNRARPKGPVVLPWTMLADEKEALLVYDFLHAGERRFGYHYQTAYSVSPDEWESVARALAGWLETKTGDEQVAYLRNRMLSDSQLVCGWAHDALRAAGLGQRRLDAEELKQWMATVYDRGGRSEWRALLFGTLLRANWNELRGEILPVAERLELDHWWMGEFLKTIARVAPGDDPETEGIMEAVRALRAELD